MWSAAASCRFSRIAAVNPKLKLFDDQQTSFLESINYKMQILILIQHGWGVGVIISLGKRLFPAM